MRRGHKKVTRTAASRGQVPRPGPGVEPPARSWLVMLRDMPDRVRVAGMARISASLILDMDTGLALGHGIGESPDQALAAAVQTALTKPAGTLKPSPPTQVLCVPAIAAAVSLQLAESARKRVFPPPAMFEVDPVPEGEDIFDSLVGHMSRRRQPAEQPAPSDWELLYCQAHRFAEAAPWDRWSDSVELKVVIDVDGRSRQYCVKVLGNAAIQHGLALYPGDSLPAELTNWQGGDDLRMPDGTLLMHLDPPTDTPGDLAAKAVRYGWPADANLVPTLLGVVGRDAADLGRTDAQCLSVTIEAVMRLDARGPVVAGSDTAGELAVGGHLVGAFRIASRPSTRPS